ncbi:MAG: redoxin family protein [Myxococcales bacterium]|nr:redoxin family protein [Myxococcales bacterium]
MDRLSTLGVRAWSRWLLALTCGGAAACSDGGGAKDAPARSRVDAVQAEAPAAVDLSGFCETLHEPAAAPPVAMPMLRDGSPPDHRGKKRWINVWATWCKPCIEELPRLARWHQELSARSDFDLVFVAADADHDAVAAFAAAHPEVEGTLELRDAGHLDPWVQGLGLAGSAVLPVHIFVGADDRVRCLRSAGVGEADRPAIEQLLVSM